MAEKRHATGDNIELDESQAPIEFADEELMTVEQVAGYFGCSVIQVREWIDQGLLTPIASGAIERIARTELERVGNPNERAAGEFEDDHGAAR